jgi:ABC-type Fe3+/spermidine/putrescine transport system ATPase subunit
LSATGAARAGAAATVVDVAGVTKRYGPLTVLDGCALAASEGEILTLLGPSGCGKTTLLRCIAGFIVPDAGSIRIDGADMGPVPVNRRPVGVVFQSYALFPHLTVAGNVAYGLKMRGTPKDEIARRVADALATVALGNLGERYPAQLSGGQQQRVAVARVMVLRPRVLLLDEPFSALDAKLRGAMQVELRQLIKRLGITAIFVTHDQEEAMTLSDRIAVMRAGRIEQLDRPVIDRFRPATAYVADFIGASNMLARQAGQGAVRLPDGASVPTALAGTVQVMVRPHNIDVRPGGEGWVGQIAFRRHVGAMLEYEIIAEDGGIVRAVALHGDASTALVPGAKVSIRVRDPAACMVYPAA